MHFLPENRMCAPPHLRQNSAPPHLENPGSATAGMLCSVQLKSMEGGHHLFFCVFVEFGAVEERG